MEDDFTSPFPEPFEIEISDVLDLHAFAPRDIKSVTENYLEEARAQKLQNCPHYPRQRHWRSARNGQENFRTNRFRQIIQKRRRSGRQLGVRPLRFWFSQTVDVPDFLFQLFGDKHKLPPNLRVPSPVKCGKLDNSQKSRK